MLLLLVCLFLRSPSFWIPLLDIDESQFALFADTLLEGGRPYLDSVDTKPLGIYWFFELCFWLFGKNNMVAVHLAGALWVFLTAFFCAQIAKRLGEERSGFWAALFYLVFTTTYIPKYISTSIVLLMMLPLTVSIYCLLRWEEARTWGWVFLSGLFFGVGCLFKYQAGIHLILGLLFFVLIHRTLVPFLITLAGAALIGLGFVSYLHTAGVWDDFSLWSLQGSFGYMQASLNAVDVLKQILIRFGSYLAFTFFVWYWAAREFSRHKLISLWFVLSLIPVFAGLRFYSHYFIQLLPSLSILAALSWVRLKPSRAWLIAGVLLPAVGCFAARLFMAPVHHFFGEENLERYRPVGAHVASLTEPSDPIYVWGFATPIYFYAERRPASRFLWNDWQTGRVGGGSKKAEAGIAVQTFETKKAWTLFFEDLEKNRPAYFLDTAPGNYHDYGKFPVSRYPMLHRYLQENYFLEGEKFGVDFYRRKGAKPL